jgi:Bacterial SH3 domain
MRRIAFAFVCTLLLSGPALGAAGDVLTVIGDRVNVRSGPSTESDVAMQVSRNQRLVEIDRQGDWVHAEIRGTGGAEGWIHGSLVAPPNGEPLVAPAARQALADQAPRPPSTGAEPAPAGEAASLQSLEDATDAAAAEPEPAAGATAGTSAPAAETAGAAAPGTEAVAPDAGAEIEAVDLQRFRDSVAYLNSRAKSIAGVDLFTEVEPLDAGAVQVGATDAWADIPPAGQRSYATALLDRWAAATGRADQLTVQIVDRGGQVIMEQSKP